MDVPAGYKVDVLFVWRPQNVLILKQESDVPAGYKVDVLFVWRPQNVLILKQMYGRTCRSQS